MKNNCYKNLMKLFAAGMACAAILIGCPAPAGSAAGNAGGKKPAGITQSGEQGGTGSGQEISPQDDDTPQKVLKQ